MTTHDTRPVWPFNHITTMSLHPRGQWVKKINGKIRYFGASANPDPANAKAKAALAKFLDLMQQMERGDVDSQGAQPAPVVRPSELTLDETVNAYMTEKHGQVERGELSARQFTEYRSLGSLILKTLGKERTVTSLTPADFTKLRAKLPGGPVRMGNEIVWTRSILRWATDNHGVAIRYGTQFDKPARRVVRKAIKTKDLHTAADIKAILDKASDAVKAMILLAINGGFGQTDIATLPRKAVDMEKGIIDFDRNKTGIHRIVPLWSETVEALKSYKRPNTAHPELFFVTRWGNPWVHDEIHRDTQGRAKKTTRCDAVDVEFDKAQREAGLPIRGFYNLRHLFRTTADDTGDLNAIRAIMGHAFPGMDEFYLHINSGGIARLRRVVDRVHSWLYEEDATHKTAGPQGAKNAEPAQAG